MKKLIKNLLLLLLTTLIIAGCATNQSASTETKEPSTVTIWAEGSDNVRIQMEKQIEAFNALNTGYTAKLEFIPSGTGAQGLRDRLVAAKLAGETNTNFDLIEFGGDGVNRYIDEGGEDLFVPLDTSKIENYGNLQVKATFRNDLVMPYRGTTVVLAYNSETVANPPKTTEELYEWIKNNPGRFAYNTPGSGGAGGSFVATSVYNFLDEEALLDSNEARMSEWEAGFNLLKELHPYMYKSSGKVVYPNKNQGTLDLLASKEVDIIPAWADMTISQLSAGTLPESIKITQLEPSFTGSTVVFGIPSIGSNTEGAYAFMSYMLSPQAQNIALEAMAAIPVVDFSTLNPELTAIIKDLKIEKFRIMSIGDLSTKLNEKWEAEIGTME